MVILMEKLKKQIDVGKNKIHYIRLNDAPRAKDDPCCHNRWDAAIPPILKVDQGDVVVMETRDAIDGQTLEQGFNAKKIPQIDFALVHPLTGPVYVNGARPGDMLAVEILDVSPLGPNGYTTIIPGINFLRDLFPNPWFALWDLAAKSYAVSKQIPNVRIPAMSFMGVMGVSPSEEKQNEILKREKALADAGSKQVFLPEPRGAAPANILGPGKERADKALRTVPPRENGGNFDIRLMRPGSTVLYPVFKDGGLFSAGDAHFCQGDGEVAITPIEMPATATFRFTVRKGEADRYNWQPAFELSSGVLKREAYDGNIACTIGYPIKKKGEVIPQWDFMKGIHGSYGPLTNISEDLTLAARNALVNMIDYLCKEKDLTREQAFALTSIIGDFRIGNIVDVPNVCVVFCFPMGIFTD